IDQLYIPLHVNRSHRALFGVDLVDFTYWYSDCLSPSAQVPVETVGLLTWWLKHLLPTQDKDTLTSVRAPFAMPQQKDSHSCGVVVLSTLAHHLLDYEAWTPNLKEAHRMEWFLRLS
ncbi:hypothetical protein BC629DRAFT_1266309, partial [Irpex lacteus]